MQAAVLREFHKPLEIEDIDIASPGPREALIRTAATGVCHSDLHLRDGFFNMGNGQRLDLSRGRELPLTGTSSVMPGTAAQSSTLSSSTNSWSTVGA